MATPFDTAIGQGLLAWRRRKGWRQEDLAVRAREAGLPWTRATIAAVESGRRGLGLDEAIRLQLALGQPLARLLTEDLDEVDVTGHAMTADMARRLLPQFVHQDVLEQFEQERQVVEVDWTYDLKTAYGLDEKQGRKAIASAGESEEIIAGRLKAKGLSASPYEVACAAVASFEGRSLAEERDRLLAEESGQGSDRIRRGHITRRLSQLIESRIREVHGRE